MIKVRRIGHATFETPDLEKQIEHFTQVTGLVVAAREKDRALLASKVGQLVLQLKKADEPRCAKLAFQVAPDSDFKETRQGARRRRRQERAAQRRPARHCPSCSPSRTTRAPPSRYSRTGTTWRRTSRWSASARSSSAIAPSWCRTCSRPASSTSGCWASRSRTGTGLLRVHALQSRPPHGQFPARQARPHAPHRVRGARLLRRRARLRRALARTASRSSGGRCATGPGTTSRSTTAIPTST